MRLLPVKLFFIKKTKKFKKVVQNMSKRWSKTMPVRTPNPVFRESFFKFWNSHTNQVLKTPISSGRVTQLISAPWKVITSRRREGERGREERGFLFWAHQRQGASLSQSHNYEAFDDYSGLLQSYFQLSKNKSVFVSKSAEITLGGRRVWHPSISQKRFP